MNNRNSGVDTPSGSIDPYALFEALTGRKIERPSAPQSANTSVDGFVNIRGEDEGEDDNDRRERNGEPRPDARPKDEMVNVGCINPYALVETLVGRKLDRYSTSSAQIISDVLQTDYDELFDMKNDSVLYAGLELNEETRTARPLDEKEMRVLQERDLTTPDLSRVERLEDLEKMGLKNLAQARVKMARLANGKLRLIVEAHQLGRTVTNREVTNSLNELTLPFRNNDGRRNNGRFNPPNTSWRDGFEVSLQNSYFQTVERLDNFRIGNRRQFPFGNNNRFDDPCQGACSNSWLIAAIFSVFWADPESINRNTRAMPPAFTNGGPGNRMPGGDRRIREGDEDDDDLPSMRDERRRVLTIRLHDKGGRNNADTADIEVNYEIAVNNSSNEPVYCRSSDNAEIWPCLYEKAFARWISGNQNKNQRPDITQTSHGGDPIKAMAQINNREPMYYYTEKHTAREICGLVRAGSVNHRTISPMCAWTHATDRMRNKNDKDHKNDDDENDNDDDMNKRDRARNTRYRGANMVANHAYSVLGWASQGDHNYIVVRNPWGVTEPTGLNSYPGMITRVEPELWSPACLLDQQGVMAVEERAFREYFQCIGIAR